MWWVNAALLPGLCASAWFLGWAYLTQAALAVALALALELACLRQRGQPMTILTDGSIVLTALLVALSLPPASPWWVVAIAIAGAVLLGKHLFGGLGQNPFNPAMVGYAIVLVSFPAQLATWPHLADAVTGATPLELVSHRQGVTYEELSMGSAFGALGGLPWQWLNLAFAAGGLVLLVSGIVRWRVPLGVLLGLGIPAALTYDGGSSSSFGSPLYHWFTGATMLTAFFIATDPVTHPVGATQQLWYGVLVGALIFVIRAFGSYADGAAFAILLANCVTPWLDANTPARRVP